MTIKTGTGSSIAIGTTLSTSGGTLAEYQADTYTTIGNTESIGAFGDERTSVQFASLADSRMQKARGIANAGDQTIIFADTTGDAGQAALEAAYEATSQSTDEFNFRVQLNDSLGSNPTTYYYRARVPTLQVQDITNDGVVMVRAVLAINTAILKQDAS